MQKLGNDFCPLLDMDHGPGAYDLTLKPCANKCAFVARGCYFHLIEQLLYDYKLYNRNLRNLL